MKNAPIFDTHAHYDDPQFDPDREQLLRRLPDLGVVGVVSCGCDLPSSLQNQALSRQYPWIYFAAGFHPENLEGADLEDIERLRTLLADPKCVAVGEIGLDYHWMASDKDTQTAFFRRQIQLAKEVDKPIIVHDREAHGDTLELLQALQPKGVVHCFSGSKEMAKEIIKLGMYIGLNGVATFKNARKALEVVETIPLERLVLETDCPYLAPEPCRGQRNNSALIPHIATRIGQVLGLSAQAVLRQTAENARALYGLQV